MTAKIKTRPFDITEYLDDDEAIAIYLNSIMEEDNPSLLADALGDGLVTVTAILNGEPVAAMKRIPAKGNFF